MKEEKRKCSKCRRTLATDPGLKLYRFPCPGTKNTIRCELWAKYCFPEDEWSSQTFQAKLYSSHNMLCDRHFKETAFSSIATKKLFRYAVPEKEDVPGKDNAAAAVLSVLKNDHPYAMKRPYDHLTTTVPISGPSRCLDDSSRLPTLKSYSPTTSNLHRAAAETVAQPTNVGQNHKICISDDQPSCDASVVKQNDNNELLVYGKDEDVVTVIGNDDQVSADDEDEVTMIDNDDDHTVDVVASTLDIAENPDWNGDEENYVPQEHQGFCCNVCLGKIVGFRYRCCECVDYDICSDCESRGEHPLHYVLRVPGYRKQCEIRRVMAAVIIALTLPEDVKDEHVIKVEEPMEELPPDPLDTGEIANPEPMETDTLCRLDSQDTLTSREAVPCLGKTPKKESTNGKKLKINAKKCDISVVVDALNRKAVVRLQNMKSKSACAPLLNRVKLNESEIHPIRTRPEDSGKNIYQSSLQSRQEGKRFNIPIISRHNPRKHHFTSNKQCKSPVQPLSSSQSTEKRKVIIENVAANRENILVKEPTDGSNVPET